MDRPARLPIDCPPCENRGVICLDDADATFSCPLCNSWCTLCLEGVPTFVPITRPYRGSLIAGMRPTADGKILFEGYACDYHKAVFQSYPYIAPPMIGRYAYGEAANWQALEDAARQASGIYRYAPYGSELYPCPAELAAQVVR